MRYALVADATVSFWRREDTLKLKREQTVLAKVCLRNSIGLNFGYALGINMESVSKSVEWIVKSDRMADNVCFYLSRLYAS